jgi:hypothetical protein
MQAQKTKVAAAGAAGALGGARQQKPPVKEWYTIVVYEKRSVKRVVLYAGRTETFVFSVPADINIGNIAVIIRRWYAGGKVPAYSASIHVKNLAELLRRYAPDVAELLAPVLAVAEVAVAEVVANADGAQPAVQLAELQAPAARACSKVLDIVRDMRSDGYLAVRVDEFVKTVNDALQVEAEERGEEAVLITAEDVKRCLRFNDTVRVIRDGGEEVLWLWDGAYMYMFIDHAAKMALKYGAVLMEAEKYDDGGWP